MKRKSCFLFLFLLQIVILSAHPNVESRLDSIPNEQKQDTVIIKDNASLIKEDSLYDITMDFVWRIKNAYYIGGHTNIADTTIYVKILEPKTKVNSKGSKIKIGDTYGMRLFRYYPHCLTHSIDYYHNYNLLFGKRVVCLQATDCISFIFTTNYLTSLHYLNEDSFFRKTSLDKRHSIQEKETVITTFFSIIKKDKRSIKQLVDFSAIKACQKKMGCSYSIVDHQNIRCLPPFSIRKNSQGLKKSIKTFDFSDMLFNKLTTPYLSHYKSSELETSINIGNIGLVYSDDKYITYRILWGSSLFPSVMYCTFLSFKKNKEGIKLIGLSSFDFIF